jgi:extradiol dioxygenase family protein
MGMPPFHLAFAVRDLNATHDFYVNRLGCKVGRTDEKWIDFDFFGHQISAHLKPEETQRVETNGVDGKSVPVRHFGAVLEWDHWHQLADSLKNQGVEFLIEPYIRFQGEVGEQATMFLLDPSDNAIELKSFQNPDQLFSS